MGGFRRSRPIATFAWGTVGAAVVLAVVAVHIQVSAYSSAKARVTRSDRGAAFADGRAADLGDLYSSQRAQVLELQASECGSVEGAVMVAPGIWSARCDPGRLYVAYGPDGSRRRVRRVPAEGAGS